MASIVHIAVPAARRVSVSTAPGALLPILDAEIIAVNGVPVALELPDQPHRLNPRHNPEPYILAARFLIPCGISACILWGTVDLIGAIVTHAAGIAYTSEYLGIGLLGLLAALALLGIGKRGPVRPVRRGPAGTDPVYGARDCLRDARDSSAESITGNGAS